MKKLSIIIPVFNERARLASALHAVEQADTSGLQKEIIIVDDGSVDGTRDILKKLEQQGSYTVVYHEKNRGKGAAVRTGLGKASGDFLIIQDADLEYDPADFPKILAPLISGKADVVYGSRFTGDAPRRTLFFWHSLGNKVITMCSNICTNLNLTDVETCYKAFTRAAAALITPRLTSDRFGIEIELTAEVARAQLRIFEVGISYAGRTYAEGKKIGWRDGVAALWFIIKYNFLKR